MNALEQALAPTGKAGESWDMDKRRWAANQLLKPVLAYPDQMALAKAIFAYVLNIAAFGTRRSGKTEGVIRPAAAMMLLKDNYTVRVLTTVLHAPTANFLRRSSDGGLVRMLSDIGLVAPVCKVKTVGARNSIASITFAWGSALYVEDIGSARAIGNKHGFSADLYLADEATKAPTLEYALQSLVNPTLADSGAVKIFMYTPDEEVDSLPARIAEESFPDWDRHHLRQWRNPHFGDTFEQRWHRIVSRVAGLSAEEYGLSSDDLARMHALTETQCDAISLSREDKALTSWVESLHPELLRNLFGRWVRHGARYVFPFHRLPPDLLYWCAATDRDTHDGAFAVAPTLQSRVALLPPYPYADGFYDWRVSLAGDLGYVDAYAACAKIWAPEHSVIYELETRKASGLGDDEMFEGLCDVVDDVSALKRADGSPLPITSMVGDLSGVRKGTQVTWNRRIGKRYPRLAASLSRAATARGQAGAALRAAKKWEKIPRIKQHNLGMYRGYFRFIAGGVLDLEGRHLRYKQDKSEEIDKDREARMSGGKLVIYGNDGSDAGFYADYEIRVERATVPDPHKNRSPFFASARPG